MLRLTLLLGAMAMPIRFLCAMGLNRLLAGAGLPMPPPLRRAALLSPLVGRCPRPSAWCGWWPPALQTLGLPGCKSMGGGRPLVLVRVLKNETCTASALPPPDCQSWLRGTAADMAGRIARGVLPTGCMSGMRPLPPAAR
jgi:hypothetical protein